MSEGGEWSNVKNGKGVFPLIHASGGQDDSDEVDAGIPEERQGRGLGEEFDIDARYVSNHVVVVIDDWQRRHAFVEQESKSFKERPVAT